jgi:AcrR family transcriptional regulator
MDTREKILDTAVRLFSGQGYGSTSLSQVAKEAQVSKALILWHFDSKEKLFRTVVQRSLEPYVVNVLDHPHDLPESEQIKRLIDNYYRFVSENLYSVRFVLSLILHEEKHPEDFVGHLSELQRLYRNLLADILESGRQKGVFRASVQPTLDARLIMSALHGILVQGFLPTETTDEPATLLQHLKTTLVDGLRA